MTRWKTVPVHDVPDMETRHGISARKLHHSQHAQIVHLRFAPGDRLLKHVTPVDVCFYVLEGYATIEIGDEQVRAEADTLVESPARIPHRIWNESDAPLRVLVIKTPGPNEPTQFVD